MAPKQDNRLLAIKTALGADALAVRSASIQEELSRLFLIEAELVSEDGNIDLDQVVGHEATLRLAVGKKEKRFFNGIVSRLIQEGNEGGFARYRATIVPWLWLLTRTADCRIFQEMTIPDIIKDVFQKYGFLTKYKLTGNYPKWEYCVQYRETAFNFVSRLMEQEGIYYYFEHEDGKHTLVLADSISAHKPFPGYADVPFFVLEEGAAGREGITDWTVEKELQPVKTALQDFDFKKPKTSLLSKSEVTRKHGKADFEIYDFPGEYLEAEEGERLTDVRLNEIQSQYELLSGEASARGLVTGATFKLKNHPRYDQNREYLLTSVNIEADAGEFAAGNSGAGEGEFFTCTFCAIDKAQQFRPERLTPKPIVQGPQTAIVVGPAGEEIHTDEYARVKVHFPWDRHDKKDQNSSCWIRVSQYWAGKTWGTIHIPRIGQEVIVEFLEGDPDEPIITGRVYNADQTVPYALPANKTQSGIKSRSSKGGASANFNEIRFEDKKGGEMLTIHAEKDQDISVENDETHSVGHDRTKTIDHDETTHVKHDRTETVDNNEKITIGNDKTIQVGRSHNETIGKNMTVEVGSNLSETVALNYSETVGAAMELTVGGFLNVSVGGAMTESVGAAKGEAVGGNKSETIGVNRSLEVGKDMSETIGQNQTVNIGKNLTESIEGQHQEAVTKEYMLKAKKIQLVADDEISIKTGDAEIIMKKNGDVTIKGGKINVKGSGDVTIKGSQIKEN